MDFVSQSPPARTPTPEEFLKYLDIIQAIIARLASNSFALRGWSVTLVAGLFALAAKDANVRFVVIGYLPIFAFWLFDGYYLAQERCYRRLFNSVVRHGSVQPFTMETRDNGASPSDWCRACFSLPLLAFHGALFITVTVVMAVCGK